MRLGCRMREGKRGSIEGGESERRGCRQENDGRERQRWRWSESITGNGEA